MAEAIHVEGLAEFTRKLRKLDADLPKAVRVANNDAAQVVVDWAVARVPRRTGRAAASIQARSTRTAVRVSEGSRRAPYMPWLDFGGAVGPRKSVKRAFLKEGRYLYAGYFATKDRVIDVMSRALVKVAESAGVEVD